ncbi:HDL309Wp [Eremothecium sinecaudum]|uniref:Ubiquitin carboxyl-terminal hydrolase n=1 Tax=Eremothecium sinecaudum TaxID=45286 RepID=A0A0X8HS48_9SACH|nr:HDL309Wp [Eremothecium sinecaudum]AMD20435.1 HDL309Wp [Eremothecium sinecaudum]
MSSWQTIESDVGVFTHLVKDLGVEHIQFEDVPYLEHLRMLTTPLYGVIFLFQYDPTPYRNNTPIQGVYDVDYPDELFFARQTIQDACGTQAILNTLLSIAQQNGDKIKLGDELTRFWQFTSGFKDQVLRGETMSNSEMIRNVHNSFTCPDPFERDPTAPREGKSSRDVYHFTGFIPYNGYIYELDGLHEYPIIHRHYGSDNTDPKSFAIHMAALLEERIAAMEVSTNGKFSVMAMVHDKIDYFSEKLESPTIDQTERYKLQELLEIEQQQRHRWKREIALRRQNLFGLVYELTKQITSNMSDTQFQKQLSSASQATIERYSRRHR